MLSGATAAILFRRSIESRDWHSVTVGYITVELKSKLRVGSPRKRYARGSKILPAKGQNASAQGRPLCSHEPH